MPARQTDRQKLSMLLRRQRGMQLRIAGLSYTDILATIKTEFGDQLPPSYDVRALAWEIKQEINKLRAEIMEMALDAKAIEVTRLDQLQMVMMDKAMGGDIKAAGMVIRIMDHRAKLLGLYAPSQVNVTDWRSEVIALMKQGKITQEEIYDKLGPELAREVLDSGGTQSLKSGDAQASGVIEGQFRDDGEDEAVADEAHPL